jgi:hypothetical protein
VPIGCDPIEEFLLNYGIMSRYLSLHVLLAQLLRAAATCNATSNGLAAWHMYSTFMHWLKR